MNVLLTCAGRRNYLVGYFREALAGSGRVLAGDASADSPALQDADAALVLPAVHRPDYVDVLQRVCEQHRVGLVVSLNDLELSVLAAHQDRFRQSRTCLLVSSPRVIDTCHDKWHSYQFLTSHGIPTPTTFIDLEEARAALRTGGLRYPLVVKPRWGSASIGVCFVDNGDELEDAYRSVERLLQRSILAATGAMDPQRRVLIQQRVPGQEHGLDILNDLHGRHHAVFVKRKLAMRSGETDKAITVDSPKLAALGAKIGAALGHVGNLDCDVMVSDEGCAVIDMNPRFGGGYPFSHLAGANVPATLLAWVRGDEPDPAWLTFRAGVVGAKCERIVRIERAPQE